MGTSLRSHIFTYYIPAVTAFSLLLNAYLGYRLFYVDNHISSNTNDYGVKHTAMRVIDGDTFDIENEERVRLYGINAPEYPRGCLSAEAKTRLEDLILNRQVQLSYIKKDNFGRQVSLVAINTISINEVLIEEGLAYFEKSKPENEISLILEKAQVKAKQTKRGVWSSLCVAKQENCIIKGNYRSADTTRIYHTPDCYNYDRITVKPGTTDRWFCTEEEAKKAGFRKSLDCPN